MLLPKLHTFHWELCSECTMNAVAHNFGSNVIDTLKGRGEIPESYQDKNDRDSESGVMELEVNGFFLSASDILESLPIAPKLKRLYLEIGEPDQDKQKAICARYKDIKPLSGKDTWDDVGTCAGGEAQPTCPRIYDFSLLLYV
eukprot:CAMPEP_0170197892 /NCGR_PEP_ID=MMETSP0040_2-20121228/67481_1 /TAXON_ID=641309 /ORGANISM="Lotharella oceanica, Strain CCMP622" /LENGTH=142 /DNA_ID=CAMNT_0010447685 /DNA_START=206 /DNA_END=631 /DNA_ORIENTATION=+